MPIPTPSRTVRALSAGAALASASLAAASSYAPLQFSSVNAATAIINLGSTTATGSYTGPSTIVNVPLAIGTGSGTGIMTGANAGTSIVPGYSVDLFGAALTASSAYTAGVWTVTFDLNVSQTAIFKDLSLIGGGGFAPATWTVDTISVTDGGIISAGTHVFTGTFVYSGPAITTLQSAFGLAVPATGGVPLPGAAGLAAVGLAGLSRRRRR